MLSNGAIVGMTAGVVGAVIGLLAWLSFESRLETLSAHRIRRWDLPWWAIAAALLLAVMTSVGAAWWPARAASRGSVMTALSNRPPRPRPARHFAALGGVVSAGALVLLWFARDTRPLVSVFGIIAANVGMLLLAPLAVRMLGRLAGRSPIAIRLALRDLARYQGRSAAALGAITLAVAIAMTTAVSAAYEAGKTPSTAGNLGANQLVLHVGKGLGNSLRDFPPTELDAIRKRVSAIAKALEAADVVELDGAVNPDEPEDPGFGPGRREAAALVTVHSRGAGTAITFVGPAYVATPAVLAHFGIKASQIHPATDLLSSRKDLADVKLRSGPRAEVAPKVQPFALPTFSSGPNTLITEQAVQRLGLHVTPSAWLFQTSRPLKSAQVNAARRIAAAGGVIIETRKSTASLSLLGNAMTGAGVVLALAVLALTVGLIRTETANDLRTLTATGASAATRRAVTGVTAGVLALLGATLGATGAYLALGVWHHSRLHPLHNIPVVDLLLILIGLPVAAAAGGWVLAGRQPSAIARQPLD
jgi:putative ABC transport system permease protein